ncbi:MAG: MerR family transcriptional regulator [Candidatus Cloacimonetes bacterium]|nr:MerR family transcriptional regulator [Candidatus Cloacimonadota bacterium]
MKKYYYTIGEVCNLLDLKPHVLRYWESEFRQLNPHRTQGGSRRYTTEQIELIKIIKDLLYIQKFTIKGVKKKLSQIKYNEKYKSPVKVKAMNDEYKEELVTYLQDLKSLLKAKKEKEKEN